MKRFISVMLLCILVPVSSQADEVIEKGETLTMQRCIEIALAMQPSLNAARSAVAASESRVGQARSNYYPQVSASAAYSRIKPTSGTSRGSAVSTPGGTVVSTSSSFDLYSGGVSLSQNIYDFGKTGNEVDVQKLSLGSSRSDLDNTSDQVVFNVKQAYYALLQAERNKVVSEETVRQFEQHLEQAKGFYEVGTKPKFDVTKAQVDLSNARLGLIRAGNALQVARVTLNNTMGLAETPEYSVEDNLSFEKYTMTFEEAIKTAYTNRPDLKSLEFARMAAEKSVELAQKGYYPFLTGNAAYNKTGESFPLDEGWSAGVALSIPIFNGFITKNQVAEARANLSAARANESLLRENILLDVQQAYLNLTLAEESIANTELTVKQATENLDIANGRYAAGVGIPIEVTDAEVTLTNAKTAYIQSLYDYKVSRAALERAMGLR